MTNTAEDTATTNKIRDATTKKEEYTDGSSSNSTVVSLELTLRCERVKFVEPTLAVIQGHDERGVGHPVSESFSRSITKKESFLVLVRVKRDIERLNGFLQYSSIGFNQSRTGRWQWLEAHGVGLLLQFRTQITRKIERNKQGLMHIECHEILSLDERKLDETARAGKKQKTKPSLSEQFQMHDKTKRHALFAEWIVQKYGLEYLSKGAVLDVAGGKGEVSEALLAAGVPSVLLLDPKPRIAPRNVPKIPVIAHALKDDGTDLFEKISPEQLTLLKNCSLIAGMHPDQATDPIIELAKYLEVPFAFLPCCVMPSLFPHRMYQGQPVRSYRTYCDYLQTKQEGIQLDYLPFLGRNIILYVPVKE